MRSMKNLWELSPEVAGRKVKEYRLRNGMSQREFSRLTKVARKTLARVEKGENVPELTLAKIARNCPEVAA